MKMFLLFFCLAVFGVTVPPCEGKSKRQIWPAPGPDFLTDFRRRQNIPRQPSFDYVDSFWVGPPRFDQRPGNQNGFGKDDFFNDFIFNGNDGGTNSNNAVNGNGGGNRRPTTENLGPITSTPRTIHTAPQNCNCPMTQQFNPICGTDGNTYRNKGLLNCYQRCGRRLTTLAVERFTAITKTMTIFNMLVKHTELQMKKTSSPHSTPIHSAM